MITDTPFMRRKTILLLSGVGALALYYLFAQQHNLHVDEKFAYFKELRNKSFFYQIWQLGLKDFITHFYLNHPKDFYVVLSILVTMIVSFMVLINAGQEMNQEDKELLRNNKQYCNQISKDEYNDQAKYYTQQQLLKLHRSKEYKKMQNQKGRDQRNWNWQMREPKLHEIVEEEEEYLRNVEAISNEQYIAVKNKDCGDDDYIQNHAEASTKETSYQSNDANRSFQNRSTYNLRNSSQRRDHTSSEEKFY